MLRSKMGRGGQQHHVDAAVDHLPIGVEADKAAFCCHVDACGSFGIGRLEQSYASFDLVRKDVAQRNKPCVRIGLEGLNRGAASAAAAAAEPDLQRIVSG